MSATKKRRAGTRWAEMLDDARAGRFSMVVAVDMDRLLRSTKDLNTLIDLGLRKIRVDREDGAELRRRAGQAATTLVTENRGALGRTLDFMVEALRERAEPASVRGTAASAAPDARR